MTAYSLIGALQSLTLNSHSATFTVYEALHYTLTGDIRTLVITSYDSSFERAYTGAVNVTDLTLTANDGSFPRAYTLTATGETLTLTSYTSTFVYALNYTLTGIVKTLTLTSTDPSLVYNRGSPVGVTDLTLSDNASSFSHGKKSTVYLQELTITAGSSTLYQSTTYTLTGVVCVLTLDDKPAIFVYNQILVAAKEELSVTSYSATLTKNKNYTLTASCSTLILTGWGSYLHVENTIPFIAGNTILTVTGNPATFTIVPHAEYTFPVAVCDLKISGKDADLESTVATNWVFDVSVCTLTLTGNNATLIRNPRSYTLSCQMCCLYPIPYDSTLSRSRTLTVGLTTLSITPYDCTFGNGLGIIADTCTLTLMVNDIPTTEYVVVMVMPYDYSVSGVRYTLPKDNVYDVLNDYTEVIEDGTIVYYHEIYYSGRSTVLVPEDYCVLVHLNDLQQDRTMLNRFVREREDTTECYATAYQMSMGIIRNPYCDVDKHYFHEEPPLTADYD